MYLIVRIISVVAISAAVAGCDKPRGTGAAITSTVVERESGKVVMPTLYGYSGANNKIAFAIFTNIESENAVPTVAASWRGQIVIKGEAAKPVLVFQGAPEEIEINGTRHNFAEGRVFLASYLNGELTVKQLELPIKDADRDEEITRLGEQQEVQDFLKK